MGNKNPILISFSHPFCLFSQKDIYKTDNLRRQMIERTKSNPQVSESQGGLSYPQKEVILLIHF